MGRGFAVFFTFESSLSMGKKVLFDEIEAEVDGREVAASLVVFVGPRLSSGSLSDQAASSSMKSQRSQA